MHILYIHQHFATPEGATGTRSYEFARRWVKAGHKVTLITGCYDIGGLKTGEKRSRRVTIEGIDVRVVGAKYSNKQSFLRRIASFLSFCLLSVCAGLRTRKVDVIYATSTPLTIGIPAVLLKWLKRAPYVFEVRDQWPEVPIELGVIRNRFMIKLLLRMERTIYNQSAGVVALSPGMAEGVRSVLTKDRPVTVIPNCCDTNVFHPGIDASDLRMELGWGDKLVLLHFGAMGRANGLEFVVRAADKLREHPDIFFVLVGDGSERPGLQAEIDRLSLDNIRILDPKPKSEMARLIAACDVSMVIFADHPILEHNSANKFFDSLSAGKPILLNYSGWQRELLEKNQAGFACSRYNLDEFVERVLYLNSHRDRIAEMGKNARRVAVEEFDRDKLADRVLSIFEKGL
ncbi:MAG: glycosyltransferase family 4 protein [Sedimentisphaerales bacterium]|nr:glycosyltransferase family 4 protein [Sedimentisphaerales bacterium]